MQLIGVMVANVAKATHKTRSSSFFKHFVIIIILSSVARTSDIKNGEPENIRATVRECLHIP